MAAPGGGKGALIQDDVSATLSTSNMQTIFQPSEECTCYALQGNMIGREDKNGPRGDGINDDLSFTLNTTNRHAVAFLPFNATQITSKQNGSNPQWGDPCHTLSATDRPPHVVCMADASAKAAIDEDLCGTLHVGGDAPTVTFASNSKDYVAALQARDYKGVGNQYVADGKVITHHQITEPPKFIVRKLMPIECERLQGFPDGWTDVQVKGKPASDAARYKALGNSMAVPVMRWIGKRIARCEA